MRLNGLGVRLVTLAACMTLGGCQFAWMSADDKINTAVPVAQTVQSALSDLLTATPAAQRKQTESAYANKLKLRALTCAKGYSPSRFASVAQVRKELTDRACFVSADAELGKWIGMRRVAGMLAEPALAPIPASAPKFIVGDAFIQSAQFAGNAGVALLFTQQSLQAIDIGTGKTYFTELKSNLQPGSLSPNGRLFITSADGTVRIRSTESGAVILEMPKARAHDFQWIDKETALYNTGDTNKTMLVDFANAEEMPVPEIQGPYTRVVPVEGAGNQFLIGTYRTVMKASIERNAQEARLKLIDEKPLLGTSWALNTSGLTADGARWFAASKDLTVTSIDTLAQTKTVFDPLYVQTATPTPDAGKVLLTGFIRGESKTQTYLYSLGDETLAQVDRSQLVSERLLYIPSLKKQAVIADSKIAILDEIPVAPAVPLDKFIADATEQANLRKLEMFQRNEALQQGQGVPGAPNMVAGSYGSSDSAGTRMAGQRMAGPFGEMAKDAQIESIGVYQGARLAHSSNSTENGIVEVRVRRSPKPILLILSSYESVRWNLSLEPGARLAGVLVSGYKTSQVTGNGSARVMVIGGSYAYKMDSADYLALNAGVQRLTGKPIHYFQGRYEGASFSVGGS
jgi:hypothetical protein